MCPGLRRFCTGFLEFGIDCLSRALFCAFCSRLVPFRLSCFGSCDFGPLGLSFLDPGLRLGAWGCFVAWRTLGAVGVRVLVYEATKKSSNSTPLLPETWTSRWNFDQNPMLFIIPPHYRPLKNPESPRRSFPRVAVAYEPVWAVGEGATPCQPEEAGVES